MTRHLFTVTAAIACTFGVTAVSAQECAIPTEDPFELTETDIGTIYDCIKDKMVESYAKEGDRLAMNYRNWTVSGTRPAVAGPHGNRLLLTFANPIAAEEYLKFAEEGVEMPIGSVLAKESISIDKKNKQAKVGPLFVMTKVASDEAPETDGWVYSAIQPNGKPMKFKQSFCHDCHVSWEAQDALAYPLEEVRISN